MTQSETTRLIAQKIRLMRIENGLSLRELAKKTKLSYGTIHRIEQGKTKPKPEVLSVLKSSLNFRFSLDSEYQLKHKSYGETLINHTIYGRTIEAKRLANELYKERAQYVSCLCFIEYYSTMLFYATVTNHLTEIIEPYYHKLNILRDGLTQEQNHRFLLQSAIVRFKVNPQDALELLKEHYQLTQDKAMRGINLMWQGKIASRDYRLYTHCLKSLEAAMILFRETNNFSRVMELKTIAQTIYIYQDRPDDFWDAYYETYNYAVLQGRIDIYHDTRINLSRYYLATHHYTRALKILEDSAYDNINSISLKTYLYHCLNIHQSADPKNITHPLYQALVQTIQSPTEKTCEQFLDLALNEREYMVIKIATKLYTEWLVKQHKYKAAYQLAEKLLNIIREMRDSS